MTKIHKGKTLAVLGRKDILDFPDLALHGIAVKVDTGAYTSSFHCHYIEEVEINGKAFLKCNFLDPSHPEYNEKEILFSEYSMKNVKSSNGIIESRYKVVSNVIVFKQLMPIELTLTERSDMKFSVLLGRKFLKNRFLVDVSRTNLSFKQH